MLYNEPFKRSVYPLPVHILNIQGVQHTHERHEDLRNPRVTTVK